MKPLILASQSPRRKALLEQAGYSFAIIPAAGQERFDPDLPLDQALLQVAKAKAEEIAARHTQAWILAADTIVVLEGKILGKPASLEVAAQVLRSLSNRWHEVKTGVCFGQKGNWKEEVFTTRVHFRLLSEKDIDEYVSSRKPLDKAGSYGIQECDFADAIEGSFSNVVGLPTEAIAPWLDAVLPKK